MPRLDPSLLLLRNGLCATDSMVALARPPQANLERCRASERRIAPFESQSHPPRGQCESPVLPAGRSRVISRTSRARRTACLRRALSATYGRTMMSSDANETAVGAGRGRLAEVIASRGGLASPEAPFVIEHREALIYMLCEAAELEHGIMCQYLFAASSLKQSLDEGLT